MNFVKDRRGCKSTTRNYHSHVLAHCRNDEMRQVSKKGGEVFRLSGRWRKKCGKSQDAKDSCKVAQIRLGRQSVGECAHEIQGFKDKGVNARHVLPRGLCETKRVKKD
jgi:invasion protein IalB